MSRCLLAGGGPSVDLPELGSVFPGHVRSMVGWQLGRRLHQHKELGKNHFPVRGDRVTTSEQKL